MLTSEMSVVICQEIALDYNRIDIFPKKNFEKKKNKPFTRSRFWPFLNIASYHKLNFFISCFQADIFDGGYNLIVFSGKETTNRECQIGISQPRTVVMNKFKPGKP